MVGGGLHNSGLSSLALALPGVQGISSALESSTHRSLSGKGSTSGMAACTRKSMPLFCARVAKAERMRFAASFSQ